MGGDGGLTGFSYCSFFFLRGTNGLFTLAPRILSRITGMAYWKVLFCQELRLSLYTTYRAVDLNRLITRIPSIFINYMYIFYVLEAVMFCDNRSELVNFSPDPA